MADKDKKLSVKNTQVDYASYTKNLTSGTPARERVHNSGEVQQLLDYCHKRQNESSSLTPWALEYQIITGERRGEVPPTLWSDIIDDRIIRIHREQLTIKADAPRREYEKIVEHTKTHKERLFPVTKQLRDFLNRLRLFHKKHGLSSEFLFPYKESENGCITNNAVYNFYRRACIKFGFEISKDYIKGTHSFRRNAITYMLNNSVEINNVASMFGTSPEVINKNYYAGYDIEKCAEILSKREF